MVHESDKRGGDNPSRARELPSIIAPELSISGKVVSDGVVHVEGQIDGEIQCAELIVGLGGRVAGQIAAERVYVRGEVIGTIRAKSVRLGSDALVTAEVIYETLTIEHGARLDGYCRPVKSVEMAIPVDVRRYFGRPSVEKSGLPHQNQPPTAAGKRGPVSIRPAGEVPTNPLH